MRERVTVVTLSVCLSVCVARQILVLVSKAVTQGLWVIDPSDSGTPWAIDPTNVGHWGHFLIFEKAPFSGLKLTSVHSR